MSGPAEQGCGVWGVLGGAEGVWIMTDRRVSNSIYRFMSFSLISDRIGLNEARLSASIRGCR